MKRYIALVLAFVLMLPALGLGVRATEATENTVATEATAATETTVPAESTAPVQTTEPTVPVIPTEPTVPVIPTEPTVTVIPTEPTAPVIPTEPTVPVIPTEPTAPVIPTEPTVPVIPTEPTFPIAPEDPTAPTEDPGLLLTLAELVALEAEQSYLNSQITANRESFHGYCGLMVSHQMFNLGINKHFVSNDGNNQFDFYAKRKKSNGGYSITPYYAEQYELLDALNAVSNYGTRDVRNILVGFEWTHTDAGGKYGHSVFINGIIEGKVYFVESFDCYIGSRMIPEGSLITCSIEAFATYFNRWTLFDGLIHFGSGTYEEVCPRKETAVYIRTRFDSVLRTAPCVIGAWKCKEIAPVKAGQRLLATALYQGDRGLYYRVPWEEGDAFISASAVSLEVTDPEDISLSQLLLSHAVNEGKMPALSGTVTSRLGSLSAVEICIYNEDGIRVARSRVLSDGTPVQLATMKDALQTQTLTRGWYTVEIHAEADFPVAENGVAVVAYQKKLLVRQLLQINGGQLGSKINHTYQMPEKLPPDGWTRVDGKWYFIENGKEKIGWLSYMGARYYFGADGAAVTGWQTVGSDLRFFNQQGELVTGEEKTYGKSIYQLDDQGVAWFKGEIKEKKRK